MRAENLRLQRELEKESEKSRQLQSQIDALQNDPQTVERLAREKLGYAKPDETVIRFEAPPTNPATR